MSLKDRIISLATSQGGDLVGVAPVEVYADYLEEVSARLQETGATGQDYMLDGAAAEFFENLSDVRHALASAKAIVLLGVYSFDTKGDDRTSGQRLQGKTARTYAYYPVARQIAECVAEFIRKAGHRAVQGQQLPLKHAASRIGLGSYGQNGLLYTREFGSYVALRAVITDADLESDSFEPPDPPCETCGRCLKACPTGALYAPYKVNPALCINPLTRRVDTIPPALRPKLGNWVCGCDICQEVCPMNEGLRPRTPDPRARFDPERHASHSTLEGLDRCPDPGSILEQERHPIMQRNAVIALGNIGTDAALNVLRRHRDTTTPGLREYVAEAMVRIQERRQRRIHRTGNGRSLLPTHDGGNSTSNTV